MHTTLNAWLLPQAEEDNIPQQADLSLDSARFKMST